MTTTPSPNTPLIIRRIRASRRDLPFFCCFSQGKKDYYGRTDAPPARENGGTKTETDTDIDMSLLQFWWIFPAAIVFSTVAIGSGVSGALFVFFHARRGPEPGAGPRSSSTANPPGRESRSIPGVLVGSTLGSRLGKFLPGKLMEKALGIIFALVGALVLVLEFWT